MIKLFFVFFIAMLLISQYRLYRAGRQLTLDQIILEFNYSTRLNLIYSLAILAGIIIIILYPSLISWFILLLIILIIGTWVQVSVYQFLKKNDFPKAYSRTWAICSFFTYLSEIGLFACFFLST